MDFTGQAATFLMTVVVGVLLGVIFDFYRVLRGVFKPRAITTYLFDLLYWLFAIVIAFGGLLVSNWGELRFYVFLGLTGGAALYYKLLSRYAIWLLVRTIRAFLLTLEWLNKLVITIIIKPAGWLLRLCLLPFHYAGRKTAGLKSRAAGWYKKILPSVKQDVPPKD